MMIVMIWPIGVMMMLTVLVVVMNNDGNDDDVYENMLMITIQFIKIMMRMIMTSSSASPLSLAAASSSSSAILSLFLSLLFSNFTSSSMSHFNRLHGRPAPQTYLHVMLTFCFRWHSLKKFYGALRSILANQSYFVPYVTHEIISYRLLYLNLDQKNYQLN